MPQNLGWKDFQGTKYTAFDKRGSIFMSELRGILQKNSIKIKAAAYERWKENQG
jgi:hypothetical protein